MTRFATLLAAALAVVGISATTAVANVNRNVTHCTFDIPVQLTQSGSASYSIVGGPGFGTSLMTQCQDGNSVHDYGSWGWDIHQVTGTYLGGLGPADLGNLYLYFDLFRCIPGCASTKTVSLQGPKTGYEFLMMSMNPGVTYAAGGSVTLVPPSAGGWHLTGAFDVAD
jgi:hypothetical protein